MSVNNTMSTACTAVLFHSFTKYADLFPTIVRAGQYVKQMRARSAPAMRRAAFVLMLILTASSVNAAAP